MEVEDALLGVPLGTYVVLGLNLRLVVTLSIRTRFLVDHLIVILEFLVHQGVVTPQSFEITHLYNGRTGDVLSWRFLLLSGLSLDVLTFVLDSWNGSWSFLHHISRCNCTLRIVVSSRY